MSNAPFKIAFWVMSLAFVLTVLLTGLKPEAIRAALNPKLRMQEEEIANQDFFPEFDSPQGDTLVADVNPVTIDGTLASSDLLVEASTGLRPIRVASADIDAPLGITDGAKPVELDRFSFASNVAQPSAIQSPHEEEIQILVPDPVETYSYHSQSSVDDDVAQLKKHVLRLQLARARRELEDIRRETERQEVERVEFELKQLRNQIGSLKKQRFEAQEVATACVEDQISIPELEIPASVTPEPMPVVYVAPEQVVEPESRIEVTAGTKENSYSFHFENADIHDVLETLATRAGWNVVIRPDVKGTFTSIFENATPDQAFATVIKLHSYGVSFRGDYVLVRAHKDARIR